jgi:hypothetical protein
MVKQWVILIGLSAGLAMGSSAIAGGDECAAKHTRADKAAPTAEKTAAQSQSAASDESKQAVAANCPGGQCEK